MLCASDTALPLYSLVLAAPRAGCALRHNTLLLRTYTRGRGVPLRRFSILLDARVHANVLNFTYHRHVIFF